jgi:hypothetical protein
MDCGGGYVSKVSPITAIILYAGVCPEFLISNMSFDDTIVRYAVNDFSARNENIGAQLSSGRVAADHYLPKSKQGEQQGGDHKQSREGREASGIFGYQTFIFVIFGFGFIFQIIGLRILEEGRVIAGAILAGGGFLLSLYSGLAALIPVEHLPR